MSGGDRRKRPDPVPVPESAPIEDQFSDVQLGYSLEINGTPHAVQDAWIGESLLYVLRERLGLPGAKNACEQGERASCTVQFDGLPVCACLVADGQAEGR